MDIETIREYCLSLPATSEDMAFGDGVLLIRVCNKIFACLGLYEDPCLILKCNPEYAEELRSRHPEIRGAYHWNKKYWNQLPIPCSLDSGFIKELIRHSYSEVVAKLPKKSRPKCGLPE